MFRMSQMLCNILLTRHNLAVLDSFAGVMKVINHTGLWDAKLTWYSLSATCLICLYGLEIHSFRLTWLCLIIKVLATQAKFLKASGYCTVISCAFTFWITNVFSCFCNIMTQFNLAKFKFTNQTTLHIYQFSFQLTHGVKICTISVHQLPWYYYPQQVLTMTWTILLQTSTIFELEPYLLQTSTYQNIAKTVD